MSLRKETVELGKENVGGNIFSNVKDSAFGCRNEDIGREAVGRRVA